MEPQTAQFLKNTDNPTNYPFWLAVARRLLHNEAKGNLGFVESKLQNSYVAPSTRERVMNKLKQSNLRQFIGDMKYAFIGIALMIAGAILLGFNFSVAPTNYLSAIIAGIGLIVTLVNLWKVSKAGRSYRTTPEVFLQS